VTDAYDMAYTLDEWVHACYVINNDNYILWVNGTKVRDKTLAASVSGTFEVARHAGGSGDFLVDEAYMADGYEFTSQDVADLWNNGNGLFF